VNAAAWIFCSCLAWVLWVIAGYPLWLALRAHFWSRPPRSGPFAPAITAVIPVHNGVRFLSAKLASVLNSDYPPDKLNILILSDGSDDGTDDLAADFASQFPYRIRLLRLARAGKAATLNVALAEVTSDVLLFTDVRQRLDPACVRYLAEPMHDPQVGVVSGDLLILAGESAEESNVGLYRRYESWIRKNLSSTDSLLGATGSIYAIRRALAHSAEGLHSRRCLATHAGRARWIPLRLERTCGCLGFSHWSARGVCPEGENTSWCLSASLATAGSVFCAQSTALALLRLEIWPLAYARGSADLSFGQFLGAGAPALVHLSGSVAFLRFGAARCLCAGRQFV